jgi:hypothetical protein
MIVGIATSHLALHHRTAGPDSIPPTSSSRSWTPRQDATTQTAHPCRHSTSADVILGSVLGATPSDTAEGRYEPRHALCVRLGGLDADLTALGRPCPRCTPRRCSTDPDANSPASRNSPKIPRQYIERGFSSPTTIPRPTVDVTTPYSFADSLSL